MIQPALLKRNSLRVRLTLVFIGLAIIPLLLAGSVLTLQSYTVQQEQVLLFQRHLVVHVVTHIVSFVENLESELRLVNQIQPLTKLTPEQQRNTLSRVQAQEHILRELCLLDKQGQELVRVTRFGDVMEQNLGSCDDTDAFTIPMETGATYYSPVWIDAETGEPVMTISVPVIDPRTGKPDGVLAADIRFKQVWDFIASIPRSGGESVFLVDEQGKVIAHHNPSIVLRGTNFLVPEQDGMQTGLEGSRVILVVDQFQLGAQKIFVIAEQPVSEALAMPRQALIITGGLLVITLGIVTILGSLAIHRIVQPLQRLVSVAREIETGDLSQRVSVTSKSEIGVLSGAFNSMAMQLQATFDELEQRFKDLQKTEASLRISEARYKEIYTSVDDVIFETDFRGRVIEVSPSIEKHSGYQPEELVGRTVTDFYAFPENYNAIWVAMEAAGAINDYEVYLKKKNGELAVFSVTAHVVYNDNGRPVKTQGVLREITERKKAEEEIRRLNEELEQRVVERTAQLEAANQELEAFSYSVSHDLRAPLRTIDGYTRILVEDYGPVLGAEGQQWCISLQNSAQRMNELINDLLAFSRLSRLEMQSTTVDMNALVQAVYEELFPADNRERLSFQMTALPSALGDPSMLRQVWLNLLSNAQKFSAKRERAIITVGGRLEGSENLYYIHDNGAGFDMQYAEKLFDVFQRLHSERDFEGTGVGLAIVQRVIHRHGGRVWAEGEVDQGATFYFTLPRGNE